MNYIKEFTVPKVILENLKTGAIYTVAFAVIALIVFGILGVILGLLGMTITVPTQPSDFSSLMGIVDVVVSFSIPGILSLLVYFFAIGLTLKAIKTVDI